MTFLTNLISVIFLLVFLSATNSYANPLAALICDGIDFSGVTQGECQFSDAKKTLNTKFDGPKNQADKLCGVILGVLKKEGNYLDPEWKLVIQEPNSEAKVLAECYFE